MIHRIQGDFLQYESVGGSVDLLLTDPPYNISSKGANPIWIDAATGENKSTIHNQNFSLGFADDWDVVSHEDFVELMGQWACAWFPLIRKGGAFAIFISDRYVSYLWHAMEVAGFEPKRVWTWKKPAAVPFNRAKNPVSGAEYVLFGIKPGGSRTFNANAEVGSVVERYAAADKASSILYRLIVNSSLDECDVVFERAKQMYVQMLERRKRQGTVIECVVPNTITYSGGLSNRIHPTQKPTEVLHYFISLLSNVGDTILDTFAGSGSTGIACEALDRHAILIERDERMFAKMDSRFIECKETFYNTS